MKSVPQKKNPILMLVDGYSLLFRAFHSMGDMRALDGTPTGALFGLVSMLLKAIEDNHPDYLVVAFDYPAPTFRHETYSEYKAHRDRAPEELKVQMPIARELVKALGMDYEELEGYEADDIIGTLARQASANGWDVRIVTGDSDLAQIVDDHITVIQSIRGVTDYRIFNPDAVRERYGVKDPVNLIDYKALVGDPSDNIPGVKGIGEKTAKKLLAQFPTIEEIYANIEKIDEKTRDKLIASRDEAFLSKQLVTIRTDLPIKLDPKSVEKFRYDLKHIDKKAAAGLFRKLGFKLFAERLGIPYELPTEEKPPAAFEYRIVETEKELRDLCGMLKKTGRFALDFETTDLEARKSDLVGIAVAVDSSLGYYIPVGHDPSLLGSFKQISPDVAIGLLKPLLEDEKIEKICQNGKYEWLVCHRYGIALKGMTDDPMLASYLLDPDARHGLKDMVICHLGKNMTSIEELIGKRGKKQKRISEVEIEKVAAYAAADAACTWELAAFFAPRLKEAGLDKLYREVEIPLESVLAEMEAVGIKVNTSVLEEIASDLDRRMEDVSRVIFQHIGYEINLNSPKQLAELLFDRMKLPQIRGRSTDADVLAKLALQHEVPAMIQEYRTLAKIRGTYTQNLIELVDSDGRIHTSYRQTVAGTGRLSSSDPNLQNIPIRSEIGQGIRRAFEADSEDHLLLSADYSQIELRLLAHFSGDEKLVEAFRNGEDIHKRTATEVFGVQPDQVTPDMRRMAKTVNFGIIYGMGPHGLSEALGKSRHECAEFIKTFFQRFPSVKAYLDSTIVKGRETGFVTTIMGRRKFFPELRSENRVTRAAAERAAINMPLQGSAADIIKLAMVRLHKELYNAGVPRSILLQVHDELVLNVPKARLKELAELVGTTMSSVYPLNVPMVVNCKAGPNWLEMEPVGDFTSG